MTRSSQMSLPNTEHATGERATREPEGNHCCSVLHTVVRFVFLSSLSLSGFNCKKRQMECKGMFFLPLIQLTQHDFSKYFGSSDIHVLYLRLGRLISFWSEWATIKAVLSNQRKGTVQKLKREKMEHNQTSRTVYFPHKINCLHSHNSSILLPDRTSKRCN